MRMLARTGLPARPRVTRISTTRGARLRRLAGAVLAPGPLALGRAGAGVGMVTRPAALPTALGVDRATADRMTWTVQMLGAREIALGLGAWAALRRGDDRAARLWLAAGLLCDATDAVTVGAAVGRGRIATAPGAALVAVATTSAAAQAAALAPRR